MELSQLIGIGAALLGGWIGKKVGKSDKVMGGLPAQKILGPLATVLVGIGYGGVMGIDPVTSMLGMTAPAVAAHSIGKNTLQFGKSVKENNNG